MHKKFTGSWLLNSTNYAGFETGVGYQEWDADYTIISRKLKVD